MNGKLIYETPLSELILLRFEENILSVDTDGVSATMNGFNSEEQEW